MKNNISSKTYLVKEDLKRKFKKLLKEEKGETNIVSIISIIIIVIGLAIIFRAKLTELVNGLFEQIEHEL